MKKLSNVQLAWAAGIIDGEGTVSFTVRKAKSYQKSKRIQPIVEVEITSKEIVFLLQSWFDGFVWCRQRRKNTYSNVWLWRISSRKALNCIKNIFPYLRIKKSQAETIFKFYDLGIHHGKKNFGQSKIMIRREKLLKTMRYLNLKGQKR